MMSGNFSSFGNFSFLYGFHKLFAIAILLGLILFITWAIKSLKKDQLKNWSVTLLIIGILGWLLTSSFGGYGMHGRYGKGGFGYGMMGSSGMSGCMQDEECHEEMEDFMHQMMGLEEHE